MVTPRTAAPYPRRESCSICCHIFKWHLDGNAPLLKFSRQFPHIDSYSTTTSAWADHSIISSTIYLLRLRRFGIQAGDFLPHGTNIKNPGGERLFYLFPRFFSKLGSHRCSQFQHYEYPLDLDRRSVDFELVYSFD